MQKRVTKLIMIYENISQALKLSAGWVQQSRVYMENKYANLITKVWWDKTKFKGTRIFFQIK